jgi:hypothetical protein
MSAAPSYRSRPPTATSSRNRGIPCKGESGADTAPQKAKLFDLFRTDIGRQRLEAATGAIPRPRDLEKKNVRTAEQDLKDSEKVLKAGRLRTHVAPCAHFPNRTACRERCNLPH